MTGYQSKKNMAQAIDKVNWADHEPDGRRAAAQGKLDSMEREALKLALEALEAAEIDGNCEYGATEIIRKALAQPAQDKDHGDALTIAYQSGYYDGKKAALAGREWNFCERCGKRTADLTTIHTCTPPPQEKNA